MSTTLINDDLAALLKENNISLEAAEAMLLTQAKPFKVEVLPSESETELHVQITCDPGVFPGLDTQQKESPMSPSVTSTSSVCPTCDASPCECWKVYEGRPAAQLRREMVFLDDAMEQRLTPPLAPWTPEQVHALSKAMGVDFVREKTLDGQERYIVTSFWHSHASASALARWTRQHETEGDAAPSNSLYLCYPSLNGGWEGAGAWEGIGIADIYRKTSMCLLTLDAHRSGRYERYVVPGDPIPSRVWLRSMPNLGIALFHRDADSGRLTLCEPEAIFTILASQWPGTEGQLKVYRSHLWLGEAKGAEPLTDALVP